jgi:hypothetical protein
MHRYKAERKPKVDREMVGRGKREERKRDRRGN